MNKTNNFKLNKMENFKQVKEQILQIARDNSACQEGFSKAEKSENYSELLTVVVQYSNWCYNAKILHESILSQIPSEELEQAKIFYKKEGVVQKEGFAIYHSSTSKHYHSSTSEHYDSSTSEHYHSSTSEHYDSSTSEHYGSSTSKHYGSSTFGSVYLLKDQSVIKDQAIIRERSTGKVYMRKGAFEIVLL